MSSPAHDPPLDAYVFDLYGTLVDYGALGARYGGGRIDGAAFVMAWRQKQLQYMLSATVMERYAAFDTITGRAYAYVAALYGLPNDDAAIAAAVGAWSELPAFPDAAETLRALRARGYRTAILSNGTPAGIAAAVATSGLQSELDTLLSVEPARVYKPHADVYRLAVTHFQSRPERIAFVSSNGWDAAGAAEFGFVVTWCNRTGLPTETFGASPARTIANLAELLD